MRRRGAESILGVARQAWRGSLPDRYTADPRPTFHDRVSSALRPGIAILDVGAGASPCVPRGQRPESCRYIGLDVSEGELRSAQPGSYDEIVVSDATDRLASLEGGVDLVVSWFAFEHIKPLPRALENIRSYLRPGGRMIANLSGAFSLPSLLNRALPERVSTLLATRLFGREPQSVFPAHYDRCWYAALETMLQTGWSRWEIVPIYLGARYFRFSPPLRAAYLAYEEWTVRSKRSNLAQYYLVDAHA